MGQTERKSRQLVQYDDLAARNNRETIGNSSRKQRTGREPIRSGSRKQRTDRESARSSNPKLRSTQYQDVELWELRRQSQSSKQRKQGKSYPHRQGNPSPVQSIKRRRAKRRKAYFYRAIALSGIVLCLVLIYFMTGVIYRSMHTDTGRGVVQILSDTVTGKKIVPPDITEDFLEINDYSRPGTKLKRINNIFVHYTANAGTTAEQNRSYFANLAETHERSASAHFIIGYDGTLLQCIPLDEEAYAVKTRNGDSISIECCYLAEDGSFTQETYDTLVHTLAWLIDEYNLSADDILRHYDCGGKLCPLYYAEHEDAWEQLREDVANYENPEDIH